MQPHLQFTERPNDMQWVNFTFLNMGNVRVDNCRDSEGTECLLGMLPCAMMQIYGLVEILTVAIESQEKRYLLHDA